MPLARFHRNCGTNIVLSSDNMVAHRRRSFAHGIVFSEKGLNPGEVFLIEIEKNEAGWSGHLRFGLTTINPNSEPSLPQYALPDLANMGRSWIFAVPNNFDLFSQGREARRDTVANGQDIDSNGHDTGSNGHDIDSNGHDTDSNGQNIDTIGRHRRETGHDSSTSPQLRYRPDNSNQRGPNMPPRNTIQSVNGINWAVLSLLREEVPTNEEESLGGFREEEEVPRNDESLEELEPDEPEFYSAGNGTQPSLSDLSKSNNHDRSESNNHDRSESNNHDRSTDRLSRLNLKTSIKPNTLPTDVGAQLGVTYIINSEGCGEMHFIFNGVDQGIYASDIPADGQSPIFAVADVYGTTKTLRVLQLAGVMNSLKNACRDTILSQVEIYNVQKLPLPGKLKNFLLGRNHPQSS